MTPISDNHPRCPNCADIDTLGWSKQSMTPQGDRGGQGRHNLGIEDGCPISMSSLSLFIILHFIY